MLEESVREWRRNKWRWGTATRN